MRYAQSFFSLVFFFATIASALAQPNFQRIATELKSGNTESLGNQFDEQVELFLEGSAGHFSRSAAKEKLQQFFLKNQPQSFALIHKGASRGADAHYCIGKLQTKGKSFRVSIFFRAINGRYLIQEMRAEGD